MRDGCFAPEEPLNKHHVALPLKSEAPPHHVPVSQPGVQVRPEPDIALLTDVGKAAQHPGRPASGYLMCNLPLPVPGGIGP